MLNSSPLRRRFQSPPTSRAKAEVATTADTGMSGAQVKEKRGLGFAKVALGVGLAVGTLSACGQPTPPAADAGAYELESPELVLMDHALDRIDLARETEEVCTGFGEDEVCTDVDVDYHSLGFHLGHGVVQDLAGNLFVAPQIAAGGPAGVAINPDSAEVDAPLWMNGTLSKSSEGRYTTEGALFGRNQITIDGNEAVVRSPALFNSSYESLRIRNDNGVVTIMENGWDQEIVQSMGDHLLVQNQYGSELGQISHDSNAGTYQLYQDHMIGDTTYSVTYSDSSYDRSTEAWGDVPISVRQGNDGQIKTEADVFGGISSRTTPLEGGGWNTRNDGFMGTSVDYHVTGGTQLTR